MTNVIRFPKHIADRLPEASPLVREHVIVPEFAPPGYMHFDDPEPDTNYDPECDCPDCLRVFPPKDPEPMTNPLHEMPGKALWAERREIQIEIDSHGAPSSNVDHLWPRLAELDDEIERRLTAGDTCDENQQTFHPEIGVIWRKWRWVIEADPECGEGWYAVFREAVDDPTQRDCWWTASDRESCVKWCQRPSKSDPSSVAFVETNDLMAALRVAARTPGLEEDFEGLMAETHRRLLTEDDR